MRKIMTTAIAAVLGATSLATVTMSAADAQPRWRPHGGGQAIGRTSPDGMTVAERPVSVPDFLATICTALGIDPLGQNISNVGRPIRVVDPAGAAISEALL